MTYNFETMIDRSKSGSIKWNEMMDACPTKKVCPFSIADSDLPLAPEIIDGLREALTDDLSLGYNEANAEYKESIKSWFERHHHYSIDPDWLVLMPGVVTAIGASIRALTNPGDGVVILTPVYYPFYNVIRSADRKIVECPLVDDGEYYHIDFDLLEETFQRDDVKMLVLCSPHNPLGRIWRPDELQKIAQLCKRYHVVLVSDEIHCDLVMPGHEFHSVIEVCPELLDQMVICTAASKTFNIAGQFTSNIFIPNPEYRQKFKDVKAGLGIMSTNTLGMIATQSAYNHAEGWLEDFIDLVAYNDQVVRAFFAEKYPDVYVYPLEGTYLQWINFNDLLSSDELKQVLKEADIFLDDGPMFGEAGSGYERLNLSASTQSIIEMLERLDAAIQQVLHQDEQTA